MNKAAAARFDRLAAKHPCNSLDAGYERKAMREGLVNQPVFPENKKLCKPTKTPPKKL